ncbi:hypothetical protein [Burkholderia sp. BCC1970]|uniref:hypothetical protein n=1 Tax=Burkholderia sp. BCC1970 TaxID=2817437 RepID=UPI002ABDEA2D|nr:hypothetical protein [Burkholderia sp. BCC1970]
MQILLLALSATQQAWHRNSSARSFATQHSRIVKNSFLTICKEASEKENIFQLGISKNFAQLKSQKIPRD